MPESPDQGSEPLTGDALMQADDATFVKELGLDIGTEAAVADTPDTEPTGQPRDDKGRFTAAEQEETEESPEDEVIAEATAEETTEEDSEATEEAPETEATEEPEPEAPKPLTQFRVTNANGEEAEAPDLRFSFKAGGKEHNDVPLDKVVRWAQSGFHVEQVTQEAADLKRRLPQFEEQLNQRALELQDQRALNERLLTDPGFYEQAAQQFAQVNTPEHRMAREREQFTREREQFEMQRLEQDATALLRDTVAPAIQRLHEQYPTVTEKELGGILSVEMAPLMRNGRVPREQWNSISQLLEGPVKAYAEAQHNVRDGARATAEAKQSKQVTKAREEATKAKRQLAKAIAPSSAKTTKPKPKPITSVDDAADSIADEIVASIMGS